MIFNENAGKKRLSLIDLRKKRMKQVWAAEISTSNLSQVLNDRLHLGSIPSNPVFGSKRRGLEEVFILETGSQFVIFGVGESVDPLINFFIQEPELFQNSRFYRSTEEVASLMFAISSGLYSTLKGGKQVLQDMQQQFYAGLNSGGVGLILDLLIRQSIRVGKRIRGLTGLETLSSALFDCTLDLVLNKLSDASDPSVLVIGEGDFARNSLDFFERSGVKNVTVATKISHFSKDIQRQYSVNLVELDDIKTFFHLADVVLNEGSSLLPDKKDLLFSGEGNKKIIVDFSRVSAFEEHVRAFPLTTVYTPDDIQTSPAVHSDFFHAVEEAWRLVSEEVKEFIPKLNLFQALPMLDFCWRSVVFKREQEISFLFRNVKNIPRHEEKRIQRYNDALLKMRANDSASQLLIPDHRCASKLEELKSVTLGKLTSLSFDHLN